MLLENCNTATLQHCNAATARAKWSLLQLQERHQCRQRGFTRFRVGDAASVGAGPRASPMARKSVR